MLDLLIMIKRSAKIIIIVHCSCGCIIAIHDFSMAVITSVYFLNCEIQYYQNWDLTWASASEISPGVSSSSMLVFAFCLCVHVHNQIEWNFDVVLPAKTNTKSIL